MVTLMVNILNLECRKFDGSDGAVASGVKRKVFVGVLFGGHYFYQGVHTKVMKKFKRCLASFVYGQPEVSLKIISGFTETTMEVERRKEKRSINMNDQKQNASEVLQIHQLQPEDKTFCSVSYSHGIDDTTFCSVVTAISTVGR